MLEGFWHEGTIRNIGLGEYGLYNQFGSGQEPVTTRAMATSAWKMFLRVCVYMYTL